ncbi:MAG: hypothetical protein NTY67_05860 [Cyanobacteria bacterium]|nr:hypothetical protein [Cyanobacteriota bacterium]
MLLPVATIQTSIKEKLTSVVPKSSYLAEIHSRPHNLKKFIGHAAFGVALLISCLQAGAASALSFNFSFSGGGNPVTPATVTGIVSGLVDNTLDQTTGLTITILSATNTPPGGWLPFTIYGFSDGFDVSGGQVTGVDIRYTNSNGDELDLANQFSSLYPKLTKTDFSIFNEDIDATSSNSLIFTPVSPGPASVPGPLPLFGAGAAFGWSRRLRRRIKSLA